MGWFLGKRHRDQFALFESFVKRRVEVYPLELERQVGEGFVQPIQNWKRRLPGNFEPYAEKAELELSGSVPRFIASGCVMVVCRNSRMRRGSPFTNSSLRIQFGNCGLLAEVRRDEADDRLPAIEPAVWFLESAPSASISVAEHGLRAVIQCNGTEFFV
jgi:hypothetical protein